MWRGKLMLLLLNDMSVKLRLLVCLDYTANHLLHELVMGDLVRALRHLYRLLRRWAYKFVLRASWGSDHHW